MKVVFNDKPYDANLENNARVLLAMQDYIRTNGMEAVEAELSGGFMGSEFCTGELYHLIFTDKKSRGIYPNNQGCYDFVRWLCLDIFYKRIEVII